MSKFKSFGKKFYNLSQKPRQQLFEKIADYLSGLFEHTYESYVDLLWNIDLEFTPEKFSKREGTIRSFLKQWCVENDLDITTLYDESKNEIGLKFWITYDPTVAEQIDENKVEKEAVVEVAENVVEPAAESIAEPVANNEVVVGVVN